MRISQKFWEDNSRIWLLPPTLPTCAQEKDETYLHLVLEFVPDTVYRISKHYAKNNQRMPNIFVKLYAYQMCR